MAERRDFLTKLRDHVDAAAGDECRERFIHMFDEATVRMPRASYRLWQFMRLNAALIIALIEEGEIRARLMAAPEDEGGPDAGQ